MKIITAQHLGFCFGVRDAIALARRTVEHSPVTILGELVHNRSVIESLDQSGIPTARSIEDVRTKAVMITAHGASETKINGLRKAGFEVSEATCPLVRFAHRSAQRLAREGYHPVIVGLRDHVEVRGMTEDLAAFDVVLTEQDVMALAQRPKFGVTSQTTQPVERVRKLVALLRARFPESETRWIDTVCQPTKARQNAAAELARECDAVVVIGGRGSNNTRELVAVCSKSCDRVHHVEGLDDLRESWFQPGDTVGLTAGTSTPDTTIQAVEDRLRAIATRFERDEQLSAVA